MKDAGKLAKVARKLEKLLQGKEFVMDIMVSGKNVTVQIDDHGLEFLKSIDGIAKVRTQSCDGCFFEIRKCLDNEVYFVFVGKFFARDYEKVLEYYPEVSQLADRVDEVIVANG